MKIKLAQISNGEDSPLHFCLQMADKFLEEVKSISSWHDVIRADNPQYLFQGLLEILGLGKSATEESIHAFSLWLGMRDEDILAYLVEALALDLTPEEVRSTMTFILLNGGLLKQHENRKYRSIDDAWGLEGRHLPVLD